MRSSYERDSINSRMKDVVRTGRGLFHSTTPAFVWKDAVKSRNSVPAKAGTKHLPDKSQKFNLLGQFPRHSKLSRMSLAIYELKNREKRRVYMTLNTEWAKSRYTVYSIQLLYTYFWPTLYMKCGTEGQNLFQRTSCMSLVITFT